MLFPDFETGDLLTLTGTVEILWDSEETEFFEGAERLWQFKIDHGYWIKKALPLRWKLEKYSPNTLLTGTWDEAKKNQQAESEKNQWQNYKITKITNESSVIKSFYLSPEKSQRPLFSAGQFITVKAVIDNKEVIRTYTVSSSPHDSGYRISVKRETSNDINIPDVVFSSYLHDKTAVGDTLQIKAAAGDFTFDTQSERPAVFIAAGVGITPMISIARLALLEAIRTRSRRKLTMINAAHGLLPEYSCRSGQCSNCKVKLISGKVSYNQPLHTSVNDDEVLLCCAMPAEASGDDMIKVEIDL